MIDLAQRYKGIVFYNPAECRCLMDMRTVELIKKDLEILEILRENTPNLHYILVSNNYEEYKIICDKHDAETDVDEKDYEKIKEWVGGIFD